MPLATDKIPTSRKEITNRDIFDFLVGQVLPELTSISDKVHKLEIKETEMEAKLEVVVSQASKMDAIVLGNGKAGIREQLLELGTKIQAFISTLSAHDELLYGEKNNDKSKGLKGRLADLEGWAENRRRVEWLFVGAVVVQVVIIISSFISGHVVP